jgi:hypothetical protein
MSPVNVSAHRPSQNKDAEFVNKACRQVVKNDVFALLIA